MIRRSLSPSLGSQAPGLPPTRRAGGARHNVSYRVAFFRGEQELPGWALNLSRGGVRAIVEDRVELGEELDVHIDEIQVQRRGRVVWTQDEPDGTIVGIAFHERLHEPPPGVELDSSLEIAPADLAQKLGVSEAELQAALGGPGGAPSAPAPPAPPEPKAEDAAGTSGHEEGSGPESESAA